MMEDQQLLLRYKEEIKKDLISYYDKLSSNVDIKAQMLFKNKPLTIRKSRNLTVDDLSEDSDNEETIDDLSANSSNTEDDDEFEYHKSETRRLLSSNQKRAILEENVYLIDVIKNVIKFSF